MKGTQILAAVIVLVALAGIAYFMLNPSPTGYVTVSTPGEQTTGGETATGGDGTTGGETATPTGETAVAVQSIGDAVSKVTNDSAVVSAWDGAKVCGSAYADPASAAAEVVALDFADNTVSCSDVSPEGSDLLDNMLKQYPTNLGISLGFASKLYPSVCDSSVIAEYKKLLSGQPSEFAELTLSETCDNCTQVYAVHMYCGKTRPLGATYEIYENAVAIVDKATGNVYS